MTHIIYNHLEICTLLYCGNTKQALELFTKQASQLHFNSLAAQRCFLTALNHSIYNFILLKENVSLHECCWENDQLVALITFNEFIDLGEKIITAYSSCYMYKIEKQQNAHIKNALKYIHTHLQDELTLDIVCDNVNINKCYLCNLFKLEVGLSFSEYILQERIKLAKYLLTTTDHPIQIIAFKCDFKNATYFSTCFKKLLGISPSSIRLKKAKKLAD